MCQDQWSYTFVLENPNDVLGTRIFYNEKFLKILNTLLTLPLLQKKKEKLCCTPVIMILGKTVLANFINITARYNYLTHLFCLLVTKKMLLMYLINI